MTQFTPSPAPSGKVLLVAPYAGDCLEENLNPIGRMYYAASATACAPNSLSPRTRETLMCTGETSRRFDDIRRTYRHASAHAVLWECFGWLLPLFNAPIGLPALIGSVAVLAIQSLKKGVRIRTQH